MISKLFKNLGKYKFRIAFFVIVAILTVTITGSIKNENYTKLGTYFFNVTAKVARPFIDVKNKFVTTDENEKILKLQEENEKLRKDLIAANLSHSELNELRELKNSLNFISDKTDLPPISAGIIAKNDGIYYKSFTISAGSENGVQKNSIVVNGKGLVGRVYQVSTNYCKAISIIDQNSPVSFEVSGNKNDTGMLSQDSGSVHIEDESLIKGYMFNINSPVKEGDTIITSAMGMYPEGIPIGIVKQILPDEKNLLKYIVVEPFVDMKNLDTILIFNKKNIN